MMEGKKALRWLRLAVLLAGAACLILGLQRGQQLEVMNKAVKICLECIGIG